MPYPQYDKLVSMTPTEIRELFLEMEVLKGKSKSDGRYGNKKSVRELREFEFDVYYSKCTWESIYKAITYLADVTFSNFIKSSRIRGRKYQEGRITRPVCIPNWIDADEYMQFVDELIALMKKYEKPRHIEDLTKNVVLEGKNGEST